MKTVRLALALLSLCIWLTAPAAHAGDRAMMTDQVSIRTVGGEEFFFSVEMALSSTEQARGLMNRTALEESSGMLFVFGNESQRSFWMKDTLIPLDILFISRDGEIHHIHSMAKPLDETMISSRRSSMAVLEINGGLAGRLGISEGDVVVHPVFRNNLAQ